MGDDARASSTRYRPLGTRDGGASTCVELRDALARGCGFHSSASAGDDEIVVLGELGMTRRTFHDTDGSRRESWEMALVGSAGEEVMLVSGDAGAHQLGRVVAVRDFIITQNGADGAFVIEANVVESVEGEDGAMDGSLACRLPEVGGVENDARSLNGKAGACHRGVLEAVSPMIFTGDSIFFQCVLRSENGGQVPIIFSGAFLARWQCVLRRAIGSKVELRNLRKVVLFKGDEVHELRAFSATSEFYVVSLSFGPRMMERFACACETCLAATTVPRFEGMVTSVVADRGYVTLLGEGGLEVKLTFTHVPMMDFGLTILGLRTGATVLVTHAHPVWRSNDEDERILEILGVDLRTQIIIKSVSLENASDMQHTLFVDERNAKVSRLSRSLKYTVEQTSFVYAAALDVWRRAFEENFNILSRSDHLRISVMEQALGKICDTSSEQAPAPLLRVVGEWSSNVHVRSDVYREVFSPQPLGGVAVDYFDVPSLKSVSESAFGGWKRENQDAHACSRGIARGEGKVVIRAVERLAEVDSRRFILGVLRCIYGRLHVVDDSGEMEVCIDSISGRAPSPSMLNKLVVIKRGEVMCEGAFVGARAAVMKLGTAQVRLSVRTDADAIVLIQASTCGGNTLNRDPLVDVSQNNGMMFVAAALAARGSPLLAPRLNASTITHNILAPTWCLTLDTSEESCSTSVLAHDADGSLRTLKGVIRNTKHSGKTKVSISFGKQNGWFCLMRRGAKYLIPVAPIMKWDASNFIAFDGDDAETYVLPDDEDEDDDNVLEDGPTVCDVRDVVVWERVYSRHPYPGDQLGGKSELVSFRCVVVEEEWHASERDPNSKFGVEPHLKVQDLATNDVVKIYCKTSAFALPVGVGIGAKITIHRAMRHLSSSLSIYVKINPAVTTIEVNEPCGATSEYLPWLTSLSTTQRSIGSMFDEDIARANQDMVIDRRTYAIRARVNRVTRLTVRWCCPACGCDAGSIMRTTSTVASNGAIKRKLPAMLSGCDVCEPKSRGAMRPGVFDVEASVTLDDGTARGDAWLIGEAALALTPIQVRNELLALVKKHGRVTAVFTRSSDDERDMGAVGGGIVVRGHASNLLGGKDSATVRAAISYAESLPEMIFNCSRSYKFDKQNGVTSTTSASAFSYRTTENADERVRCGDYDVVTSAMPELQLQCLSVNPVDAKAEIRLRLSRVRESP